jgi:hypothetical protein
MILEIDKGLVMDPGCRSRVLSVRMPGCLLEVFEIAVAIEDRTVQGFLVDVVVDRLIELGLCRYIEDENGSDAMTVKIV